MKEVNIRALYEILRNDPEVDWDKVVKEYKLVEDSGSPPITLSIRCRGGMWLRVKTWVLNKILSPYMRLEVDK